MFWQTKHHNQMQSGMSIANKSEKSETPIRWFEPINMDTGYVFDLRFLE